MFSELKCRGVFEIWNEDVSWEARREEIKELLQREEYGYFPNAPEKVSYQVIDETVKNEWTSGFFGGSALYKKILCEGTVNNMPFSFPFYAVIPSGKKNLPFFVHMNFRPDVPDRCMPSEEISDNGFAVFSACYKDITSDNDDFSNGLAPALLGGKKRDDSSPGKIMMWAWANIRILEYALSLDCINKEKAGVIGHSRLGKTALVSGMMDERFNYVFSNDSGCSGASLSRKKAGENVAFITKTFPFWFCKNYLKYSDNEEKLPFDQHFLLASIAPRHLYVASAEEDLWADPKGEFLSFVASSEVYKKLGEKIEFKDEYLSAPGRLWFDKMGYHIRLGGHFLNRHDWHNYMEFMK